MTRDRRGFELPLLLAGAFRELVDELHLELSDRGHGDARPIHGFALQAIGADGVTISELGRRLGVSKQAAAKTAASLERLSYVTRVPHPGDGRSQVVARTAKGEEMLTVSAEIFVRLRKVWKQRIGSARLCELEDDLQVIVAEGRGLKLGDLPGWMR